MIVYQSEATTSEWLDPYFGMDRAKMVGCSYWGATEYWGESNKYPKKGWNWSFTGPGDIALDASILP